MKPTDKNIVNQLIKKQTPLPNKDYFTDLSERLLTEIKQHKAPIVPIYKKLFFVFASSAAVLLISISIFWKSNTNNHSPKQLISQKTTEKTPGKVPISINCIRDKNPSADIAKNEEKIVNKMQVSYEAIKPVTDDVISFESLEKEAIYAYLFETYNEIDEELLTPLVTQ